MFWLFNSMHTFWRFYVARIIRYNMFHKTLLKNNLYTAAFLDGYRQVSSWSTSVSYRKVIWYDHCLTEIDQLTFRYPSRKESVVLWNNLYKNMVIGPARYIPNTPYFDRGIINYRGTVGAVPLFATGKTIR